MLVGEDRLHEIVTEAARTAGLDSSTATLLRDGSNAMFLLPGGVVGRVGRPGQQAAAEREVLISRWLTERGITANRALTGVPQPVMIRRRPVTWWVALPPHRAGTPAELGAVLREVHNLPRPVFELPVHDPFESIESRIDAGDGIGDEDRCWLGEHHARLRDEYEKIGSPRPPQLIHGDAWQGNLAVTDESVPILLDFEKVSIGDRAWDLVQIAVDHTDFARITADQYGDFVDAYGGDDVTSWLGFGCYAAIQELRWVGFVLGKADDPRT